MKASELVKLCVKSRYWSPYENGLEIGDVLTVVATFNAKCKNEGRVTLLPFVDNVDKIHVEISFSHPKNERPLDLKEIIFIFTSFTCFEICSCQEICKEVSNRYNLGEGWCYKVQSP
jgi:hypothetical protein